MFFDQFSKLCEGKGVSCNQAALEIGLSNAITATWKKRGNAPDGKTLSRIADYFGVSADLLLERNTPPKALTEADLKYMKLGSNEPVSFLCGLYGVTVDDLREICGVLDARFPAEYWVNGLTSIPLDGHERAMYPEAPMRDALAEFFLLPVEALGPGGEIPVWPNPEVHKRLSALRERSTIRRYNYYRSLSEETEPAPIAAEAI